MHIKLADAHQVQHAEASNSTTTGIKRLIQHGTAVQHVQHGTANSTKHCQHGNEHLFSLSRCQKPPASLVFFFGFLPASANVAYWARHGKKSAAPCLKTPDRSHNCKFCSVLEKWKTLPGPLVLKFVDLRGPSWTFVDLRGPSWTFVDLRGPSWNLRGTFVDLRNLRGPSWPPGGCHLRPLHNLRGPSWTFVEPLWGCVAPPWAFPEPSWVVVLTIAGLPAGFPSQAESTNGSTNAKIVDLKCFSVVARLW